MANCDGAFSYQDRFHHKPYDSLALIDIERISSTVQAGKERREAFRWVSIRVRHTT
jgi:hypothetical protein